MPAPFGAVFPIRPQVGELTVRGAPPAGTTHLLAAVVGAAIALAGVLVGRRSA